VKKAAAAEEEEEEDRGGGREGEAFLMAWKLTPFDKC
jgi:hypothetical protein